MKHILIFSNIFIQIGLAFAILYNSKWMVCAGCFLAGMGMAGNTCFQIELLDTIKAFTEKFRAYGERKDENV